MFTPSQLSLLVHTSPEQAKELIARSLVDSHGVLTLAAKALGVSKRSLHRYIERLSLEATLDSIRAEIQPLVALVRKETQRIAGYNLKVIALSGGDVRIGYITGSWVGPPEKALTALREVASNAKGTAALQALRGQEEGKK